MRFQGVYVSAIAVLILGASACSSSGSTQQDPGLTSGGSGNDIQGHDTNPDGVAYPSSNLGTKPSTNDPQKGIVGKPGNIISNFKFYGYPDGDMTAGLQPVALADYFDPSNKKWKLIHIQAAGTWCIWCQRETQAMVPISSKLQGEGVAWLTAIVEGASTGSQATLTDLNRWVTAYKPKDFPNVVDQGNHTFGVFFPEGGLPWNATVDPVNMEILAAGVGAPSADGQSVTSTDVENEVTPWLTFLMAHPANPMTGVRK
jgi:hypothetical protein